MKNLLHVPQIAKNVLSVSQFTQDDGFYIEFHPDYCYVKDMTNNKVLLQGKFKNYLYVFDLELNK